MITNVKIFCETLSEFRNLEKLIEPLCVSDDEIVSYIMDTGYALYIVRNDFHPSFCDFSCNGCHSSICKNLNDTNYREYTREYKLKRILE